jgi:hypothetical protein
VSTLLPFRVGYAVPFNHPISFCSQVTSQPPFSDSTPTIGAFTLITGISIARLVASYA